MSERPGSIGVVNYQSLYRRYRPQRFADVAGQDHVSATLRNAVLHDRVAHAYLFSGPRGCGKTTSARILAKALNCTNLHDGEPCCECESCLLVASGASMDVIELDAASNNGVDNMRELVSRASLGTAGRRKVYIVDEVHMLSPAASNALLKTLEEPPDHVVFVLATTDPQKVLATIRSRTQSFEFRLFSYPALLELVRKVAAEAELNLPDETLQAVARRGNGSARDALSALDQASAAGGMEDSFDVSELADAVAARDSSAVLLCVDRGIERGRDPRQLARDLIEVFRNVFLVHMGRPAAADPSLVSRLGPAAATRSIETMGDALVAMRDAVEPRVVLEVALLRLVRPDLDTTVAALQQRIEVLESSRSAPAMWAAAPTASPSAPEPSPPAPSAPSAPSARSAPSAPDPSPPAEQPDLTPPPAPGPAARTLPPLRSGNGVDPSAAAAPRKAGVADAARAQLAGNRAPGGEPRPRLGAGPVAPSSPGASSTHGATASASATATVPVAPTSGPTGNVTLDQLNSDSETLLESVGPRARALFRSGSFAALDHGVAVMSLPNAATLARAQEVETELANAIAQRYPGTRLRLRSDDDAAPVEHVPPSQTEPAAAAATVVTTVFAEEHEIDLDDLVDAPADSGSTALDQITAAFPGAAIVE